MTIHILLILIAIIFGVFLATFVLGWFLFSDYTTEELERRIGWADYMKQIRRSYRK